MIEEVSGRIDYDEVVGAGPTIVLVPGSCSTGAAWRPIIAAWDSQFRCVSTSLLGYGGTAERRTDRDPSFSHEVDVLESVMRKAGGRAHLVGHSYGGDVALAVALRNQVPLASLVIVDVPGPALLRERGEDQHYLAFCRMRDAYFADFESGNVEAIASLIDFYGGTGTFASWPPRVRAYAVATTPVNIRDVANAFALPLSAALLATVQVPVLVIRAGSGNPAVQRANELFSECISGATLATVAGAAHFLIATHAGEVANLIAQHVFSNEPS